MDFRYPHSRKITDATVYGYRVQHKQFMAWMRREKVQKFFRRVLLIFALTFAVVASLLSGSNVSRNFSPEGDAYGYVISTRQDRFQSTANVLRRCNITPKLLHPIAPDSDLVINAGKFKEEGKSMIRFAKTLSNKLTHIKALQMIAKDPQLYNDSWGFVFEDDIAFNHGIDEENCANILSRAMEISIGTGYMQLGLCNPGGQSCGPMVDKIDLAEVRHCCGLCAHAYGATKMTAEYIYTLMYRRNPLSNVSNKQFYYFDQQMLMGCWNSPVVDQPLLIGSNIFTPGGTWGHVGLFKQDREKFPSEILE